MHDDQIQVTGAIVRRLVDGQFPEWSSLPVEPVTSEGTVNAIFRVGPHLAARLPLRPGDPEEVRQGLQSEAAAARELGKHTTFPVPEPVAIGDPGSEYPLPWSVQTWLPGTTASDEDVSASDDLANDLAELITQIRAIDVGDRAFTGGGRGGDLRSHDDWMEVCFAKSEGLVDVVSLRRTWARLRELSRVSPDVMTHGDLIPGNVLVSGGRLAGILDAGGLGPTDPALDLVCAWHLFDEGPRQTIRTALGCSELEWERGKAWALEQAMGAVWYYAKSNPSMSRMGRTTLHRILSDEPAP